MAYYFPVVLTACFAAITVTGWSLSNYVERALTSAMTTLAVCACAFIYI